MSKPLCNRQMRTGLCQLDTGHRGRCSTWAFLCDGCGQRRRSRPEARALNPWDGIVEAEFCFMCTTSPWMRSWRPADSLKKT